MRERVLIDETIEVLLQRTRDFARLPWPGTIEQTWGTFLVKAVHPLSHRRIGKVEAIRDLLHPSTFDDFANRLGASKDPRFFGLFDEGI
jgi:hypothetical protein